MSWRRVWTVLFVLGVFAAAPLARAAEVETAHLVVSDPANRFPPEQLRERAARIQGLFDKIVALWQADPDVGRQGKIRVVLIPRVRELRLSVFHMARNGAAPVREVLAAPPDGPAQMLAHKLTTALFPSKDKLVRNMMGEVSEMRLGNPRSFPHCGLGADAWVLALRRQGRYLPLRELGLEHAAWGMTENDKGVPLTSDPDRHHRAYAEAASFGGFLFARYGMAKLKEFCRLTGDTGRPWDTVYGAGLDALEAQWLEALNQEAPRLESAVALAADLYAKDPSGACDQAQKARP